MALFDAGICTDPETVEGLIVVITVIKVD